MSNRFSASDLAELKLPGLPSTRQYCSAFIARVRESSPELVFHRRERGGGFLVDILALPDIARAELERRQKAAELAASEAQAEADAVEDSKRQLALKATGDLTARQRLVMEARHCLLMAIDAEAISTGCGRDRAIRALVAKAAAGQLDEHQTAIVRRANDRSNSPTLGYRTIYRWFEGFDRFGAVALAPRPTKQKQDQPAWFAEYLKHYVLPSKPSMAEALRAYIKTLPAGAHKPTIKQVRVCLGKVNALAKIKGREGKLALRARQAYTARDFSDLLPTSVYVGDGKTFDAEITHPFHGQPFRPEITTIIDVATRRAVGWSVDLDENTFAVADALRLACSAGIPAIFYTDRGPGYKNKAMQGPLTGFLTRAGITPMKALPYNSQAKGVIERLNQVYTAAAKSLPTYIGKDMDKEAKLLAFKTTRRELSFTGTSRLLPTWDSFLALIDETLAAYNDRPHSSLPKIRDPQLCRTRHMTPNELWAQKCEGFEPIVPSEDELTDMFRPYVLRKTRRALVEWLGNSYYAPELEPYHDQEVVVGYDIHDGSRVWVREIDEVDGERLPGRLIAIALFEGHKTRFLPLSAEQAAMERRQKGRLQRLEKKIDVVKQELHPTTLLNLSAAPVAMPLAAETQTSELLPVQAGDTAAPAAAPQTSSGFEGRPMFSDDVQFARWLAENPDAATASDKELLRELLTTHSSKELLRMSGVDLDALRKLARSSADSRSEHEEEHK